jgi:hypothetical protein
MIKKKKKPNQRQVIGNLLGKMLNTEKMKKKHYQDIQTEKELKGYREETKRIEKKKLKQKELQKNRRVFYN